MESNNFVVGRNPVIELLKSKSEINFILSSCSNIPKEIYELATKKHILIKKCDSKKLNKMFKNINHQGIVAQISPRNYCTVDDILNISRKRKEKYFILILDKIQDPHNFGAIIRTSECMGVHGIIIPKRRSVSISPTVSKCSCGALEYVNIARVDNIAKEIDKLKKNGVWIIGTDSYAKSLYEVENMFSESIAIVIGSEENGISEIVKKKCDEIVSIPMVGKINSLNASVASSMILLKVLEHRKGLKI